MKKQIVLCLVLIILLMTVSCDNKTYDNLYNDEEQFERSNYGLTWYENQALPSFAEPAETLEAINITLRTDDLRAALASFQGLVNREKPQIFLYNKESDDKEKWLGTVNLEYKLSADYKNRILKHKDKINGVIVWDTNMRDTLNLATTMAGLRNAIICNETQLSMFTSEPYNFSIIENLVGKFTDKYDVYTYMYENVWSECTKRLIIGLNPEEDGQAANIRDLAVASKTAVLWLDPSVPMEEELLRKFFGDCVGQNTYYIGWWITEGLGVELGSEYGIPLIPADYYENYSVYSGTSRELNIPETPPKPELNNKFYIAFTFSDGDNLQYCQHSLKSNSNLWSSKKRGTYPISWTFAPSMLDAGPQILNYYYQTATANDCLIAGPSGVGYINPLRLNSDYVPKELFADYSKQTDSYFRKIGFKVATIWDYMTDEQALVFAKNVPSLNGFTVQERLDGQFTEYVLNRTTPLLTTHPRYDGDYRRVQQIIEEQINSWDGNNPEFMIPQLIPWECGVSELVKIASSLEEKYGDKVEFVRVDHLMMLFSEAMKTPYNIALKADSVTASSSVSGYESLKATDGSFSKNNGWQCDNKGDKWLVIDLKDVYKITRYNVINAGAGYYSSDLNTVSFKIQASDDNIDWSDIDVVEDNKSNIVDKFVDEFTARYIRLLVTNAGTDDIARIQEFELYGNKA